MVLNLHGLDLCNETQNSTVDTNTPAKVKELWIKAMKTRGICHYLWRYRQQGCILSSEPFPLYSALPLCIHCQKPTQAENVHALPHWEQAWPFLFQNTRVKKDNWTDIGNLQEPLLTRYSRNRPVFTTLLQQGSKQFTVSWHCNKAFWELIQNKSWYWNWCRIAT